MTRPRDHRGAPQSLRQGLHRDDSGYQGFNPFFLPGFVLGIFAGAVVLTWMYEGARSDILVVALWHLSLNVGSATTAGEGAPQAVVTMFVIVWSIFIARAWRRRDQGGQRAEAERVAGPRAEDDALRGSDRIAV